MHIKKWHVTVSLVCIISGMLLALDLKNHFRETNPVSRRNQSLVQVIHSQEEKNTQLEAEIAKIRRELDQVQKNQASGQGFLGDLQKQLEVLKFESGLTPVSGPGVVITLTDQEKARTSDNPDNYLIHYSSILYIVSELKAAGAEAIAVNDVRVVGTSDIRCAGTVILVNGKEMAPPYTVKAIGKPTDLEEVTKNGEYNLLELEKFPVTFEQQGDINIDAYKGSFTFNYATPAKAGE